jgi:hypothetical protein
VPRNVTDRDKAYVLELFERFGTDPFFLWQFKEVSLAKRIADRFEVKSDRLDNADMIGNRLRRHGFLVALRPGKYQLTAQAAILAKDLAGPPRT